jgi:hypothetical protein
MWATLTPLATLAYCLTVVCLTAVVLMFVMLRGSAPAERPPILRAGAHVVRAWADALRFWRRR